MNVRPDMLRQQGMPQFPPNVLTLNSQQFGQQSLPQNHMNSLLANGPNANPPMGILGGGPPNGNPSAMTPMQRSQQQIHIRQQQQQALLQQAQGAQSGGTPSGPHIGGGPGPSQQNMGFPGNIIQQSSNNGQMRRVVSQSQALNQVNQAGGHMGGLHPGQTGGMGGMSMGMNPQTNMAQQLRQAPHQQVNMRMQPQIQGHVSPEMGMMNRQGNPGMAPNVARSASAQAQLMGSLSQPPALTQSHSGGMQPSLPQTNFSNPMSLPHQHQQPQLSSSPRPSGAHPQTHTPSNMTMSTPAPQGTARPPENPMFGFPNQQNQMAAYNTGRLYSNSAPFVPSPTPPNSHGDVPSDGLNNTPGNQRFLSTPAQQIEHMRRGDYGPHFNIPPQANVPPRPPSHNNHHPSVPPPQLQPQQPQHHHSPRSSEHMNNHSSHPQRPSSQPQAQPGRPPSQGGPSGTPRGMQPPLPPAGLGPPVRIASSSQHPGPDPSRPQISGPLSIAPRPQALPPAPSSSAPVTSTDSGAPNGQSVPSRAVVTLPVGLGQGLVRLLQFSGLLASKSKGKLQLSYWKTIVEDYFTPKAVMKFTLWKDNQRNEAKPFEIGVPILPRFFLVTSQAGVESMTLSLDGARERLLNQGHAVVECVTAVWTYKYNNGYTVTLRGPLTAHVLLVPNAPANQSGNPTSSQAAPQQPPFTLKFENLQFDANFHEKSISLDSITGQRVEAPKTPRVRNAPTPTANGVSTQQREEDKKWEEPRISIDQASIPGEPVNAFGIPQATMRCLELAESVGQMADLISFSNDQELGPIEALAKFAATIRGSSLHMPGPPGGMGHLNGVNNAGGVGTYPNFNGVSASPAVTLYSSAPPSIAPSSNSQSVPVTASPQNASMSADGSPHRQNKQAPQSQQAPGSAAVSSSVSASAPPSSGQHTTPLLANASLKRKQTADNASPTTANAEQHPSKRVTRKRGRTAGG